MSTERQFYQFQRQVDPLDGRLAIFPWLHIRVCDVAPNRRVMANAVVVNDWEDNLYSYSHEINSTDIKSAIAALTSMHATVKRFENEIAAAETGAK